MIVNKNVEERFVKDREMRLMYHQEYYGDLWSSTKGLVFAFDYPILDSY